ncbi:uncharacterized protein BXZ73DRAFT_46048 [Epithele typhae]|uniref:uncharacterized protein n=1 Tax=Epithele typhae TaxID=378194 RepID=UPI00200893BC|nr:uncharacterized protein BXZ73DRAFT_46048 [Epithele typhae]KAH9933996.1 hypothetical protein BXZ73DRAFT_46048 [Epithele typhae]
MENPAKEAATVATLVTAAVNPEIQHEAVLKYYAPNINFRHPICAVKSGPNSRAQMLGILQWYRIMSPRISVHVSSVTYNEETKHVYLDVTQTFHMFYSPFAPASTRLIALLKLREERSPADPSKSVYVIAEHEDFYHPDDFAALVMPPLIPLVRFALVLATWMSMFSARLFMMFGFWTAQDGEGGRGVDVCPEGEPLPPVGEDEAIELGDMKKKKNE